MHSDKSNIYLSEKKVKQTSNNYQHRHFTQSYYHHLAPRQMLGRMHSLISKWDVQSIGFEPKLIFN
jgi:hypothetical protein